MQNILTDMLAWQPSYTWILLEIFIIFLLYSWFKYFPKSWVMIIIELIFEKAYEFFEEILWIKEKKWIKMYITIVFFIILISNLLWVALEFILPIVWEEAMHHIIEIPTANINFNVAMAIVWVIIVILEQFKALWFWKAMYEYAPIFWKNYIPYERWKLPFVIDYIIFGLIKFFDIVISMFLWVLEVVWHAAKIISLSFRLFWNMTSGSILLIMLFWAVTGLTQSIFEIDFPIIGPIILYLQEILVAFIQALVFPLLIAIFIKVAKVH
jgi:F0F1-type ATP synthase membrane subunit a